MAPQHTLQELLSVADADRASRAFEKLARHNIQQWALTGGLAIEIHLLRLGRQPSIRVLNDLDFVADSFDRIPETLARDFLCRHIHPSGPPGKIMLQLLDPACALRIDIFWTHGAMMKRTSRLKLPIGAIQVISIEDLVARAARLALDLAEGIPTPLKHARDFLRLAEVVHESKVEMAWQDHRKPKHPPTFAETSSLLKDLIPAHPELLIAPLYSRDPEQLCPRCASTATFRLADPHAVATLLGYC